ncbi:cytochrome P450 [Pholiota conissans]|uniref:Cytochrome P450 n=1 Tax=Pholiota conissans TaxID=109636 RepID=A0A9P6D037_9AGAR|nr:cytochrome P450 [Pholiota conissans]
MGAQESLGTGTGEEVGDVGERGHGCDRQTGPRRARRAQLYVLPPPPLLLPSTMLPVLLAVLLLFTVLFLFPFLRLLYRQRRSPLRHLPGPPAPSLLLGNLEEMHDQENNALLARWGARYGPAYVYRGFLGGCRLLTTDPVAVAHILGNAYDYPKPDFVRESLASMAAGHEGLLTVEGEDHRRQRKILTPAFSSSHLKSLAPIFWDKAAELRDIWLAEIDNAPTSTTKENDHTLLRIDVLSWLGRATLDVIGLAGFGYRFAALTDDMDELARAFGVVFSTARRFRVMTILQVWFPVLRRFVSISEIFCSLFLAISILFPTHSNFVSSRFNFASIHVLNFLSLSLCL